jgi:putative addiction module component (TIGR02574 family)
MADSILPFDINQYSIPERVAMIGEIWDSMVDEQTTVPLTEQQSAELERRYQQSQQSLEGLVSWEEIKQRALGERK